MAQTGITAATEKRIAIGPGALYWDWNEPGEAVMGATRGGGTITISREDRNAELDGVLGPVKGLRRPVNHGAMVEATIVEPSQQLLEDLSLGDGVSDGTHITIDPTNDIELADYYANIAYVGEVLNSDDPIVFLLENALPTGEWDVSVGGDDDEFAISISFEAHYDAATATEPPYSLLLPVNAS